MYVPGESARHWRDPHQAPECQSEWSKPQKVPKKGERATARHSGIASQHAVAACTVAKRPPRLPLWQRRCREETFCARCHGQVVERLAISIIGGIRLPVQRPDGRTRNGHQTARPSRLRCRIAAEANAAPSPRSCFTSRPRLCRPLFVPTDRSPRVLGNLRRLFDHGRLAGTGYISILPVDQGIEHSAGASFAPNPQYFDPENIVRAGDRGRLQRRGLARLACSGSSPASTRTRFRSCQDSTTTSC